MSFTPARNRASTILAAKKLLAQKKYSLTGTITRADGKPAANVEIAVGARNIKTDDRGQFDLQDLKGNIAELMLEIRPLP